MLACLQAYEEEVGLLLAARQHARLEARSAAVKQRETEAQQYHELLQLKEAAVKELPKAVAAADMQLISLMEAMASMPAGSLSPQLQQLVNQAAQHIVSLQDRASQRAVAAVLAALPALQLQSTKVLAATCAKVPSLIVLEVQGKMPLMPHMLRTQASAFDGVLLQLQGGHFQLRDGNTSTQYYYPCTDGHLWVTADIVVHDLNSFQLRCDLFVRKPNWELNLFQLWASSQRGVSCPDHAIFSPLCATSIPYSAIAEALVTGRQSRTGLHFRHGGFELGDVAAYFRMLRARYILPGNEVGAGLL